MHSKLRLLSGAVFSGLLLAASVAHAALVDIDFDYSNTVNSNIQFDGASNFTFNTSTNNFGVTSGPLMGLMGELTGTFNVGVVSTGGGVSTAPVSGTGSLVLHDGSGFDLTSTLSWLDIYQYGTTGALNTSASLNLSNMSYSGTNATLLLLATGPSNGTTVLTFQFIPAVSLADLKTTKTSTSFSGSVHAQRDDEGGPGVPDSGSTAALLGLALIGLGLHARRTAAKR